MSTFSNSIPRTPAAFDPNPHEEDFSHGSSRKRPGPYELPSKRNYNQISPFSNQTRYNSTNMNEYENPHKPKAISLPYSLLIPNELIGFLIGTGGSVIREIENASSSILYFEKSGYPPKSSSSFSDNHTNNHETKPQRSSNQTSDEQQEGITDKILSIFGTLLQKDRAVDLILHRIKSLRPLQDSDEKDAIIIGVPANSLSLLIGQKGATITDLSIRSQCQIIVQKKNLNNSSAKAVSIRSSDITGLVSCISMIYTTFESFVQQGKLEQDDFVLLQDEKALRYAREVSESLANDSQFKFPPANPHSDISYNRNFQGTQYKHRNISPSPSHHRMIYDENISYRNSPPRSNDKLIKYHFGEKLPYPMDFKDPSFREGPYDLNPPGHKMHDYYDKNMDTASYNHSFRPPFKQLRRKGHFGDHDSPRYSGKDDMKTMTGDGVSPIPPDGSQPFPISPYSGPHIHYQPKGQESPPMHHDHMGNLLNHPLSHFSTQFDIKFVVQADTAAWVVGKRGDHIKEAKRHTGADISVSDAKSAISGLEADERLLTISGSIQSKFRTFEVLISPMLARIASTNKPLRLLLPIKSVSFVIGYGGATINQITHESKAEVNVEKSLLIDNDRPVTISGPPNSQLAASLLLFEKVEEFLNPDIAAKKLHIPIIPLSYNSPIHHPPPFNSSHNSNYSNREGMSSSRDGPTPHFVH